MFIDNRCNSILQLPLGQIIYRQKLDENNVLHASVDEKKNLRQLDPWLLIIQARWVSKCKSGWYGITGYAA